MDVATTTTHLIIFECQPFFSLLFEKKHLTNWELMDAAPPKENIAHRHAYPLFDHARMNFIVYVCKLEE